MDRLAISLFLALLICGLPAQARAQEEDPSYQETVRQFVRYSLVHLTVSGKLPDGTDIAPIEGTGFLVSDDGHVVTAKHVAMMARMFSRTCSTTERLASSVTMRTMATESCPAKRSTRSENTARLSSKYK